MPEKIIGPKELDVLKAHVSLPIAEIKQKLEELTGLNASEQAIAYHIAKIRDTNTLQSVAVSSSIDNKVQEFINLNTNEYLQMLDDNIHQIANILKDKDPSVTLRDSGGKINATLFNSYSGLLAKQIKLAFDIRPSEDVVRRSLNINVDIPQEQLIEKYFGDYIKEKDNIKNVSPKGDTNKVIDVEPLQ